MGPQEVVQSLPLDNRAQSLWLSASLRLSDLGPRAGYTGCDRKQVCFVQLLVLTLLCSAGKPLLGFPLPALKQEPSLLWHWCFDFLIYQHH